MSRTIAGQLPAFGLLTWLQRSQLAQHRLVAQRCSTAQALAVEKEYRSSAVASECTLAAGCVGLFPEALEFFEQRIKQASHALLLLI